MRVCVHNNFFVSRNLIVLIFLSIQSPPLVAIIGQSV